MSKVPSWPGCVRPTMSGSLARGRRPSAEGRGAHGAGDARRRADAASRRFAPGRVTREDDAPTHRKAGPSSGPPEPSRRPRGASLAPDPASPAVRVPRRSFPRRPRAAGGLGGGLAMLFALAAPMLAVPSTAEAQNNPPTATNRIVGATEDTEKTFGPSDINFSDIDSDTLSSLKIVTLPAVGTLTLSGTEIMGSDLPKTVTAVDLNDGNLKYSPPLNFNAETAFTYKVNDGTDDSLATYTLTLSVLGVNDPATGAPGITGTATVGQTLTATVGTIADVDQGLPDPFFSNASTTVQWIRVDGGTDSEISMATDSTYTLMSADEGKQVKVRVEFEDNQNNPESRTSAAYPSGGTVQPMVADTIPPRVTSVVRHSPASEHTAADILTWRVTFSEAVSNVDAADFRAERDERQSDRGRGRRDDGRVRCHRKRGRPGQSQQLCLPGVSGEPGH